MGWYNDKVTEQTARLAIAGAGGGAKALGVLAKIPLAMDAREARDRGLANDEEAIRAKLIATQMKSGASIKVATLRADSVMGRARLDRDGKHETATAKVTVADREVVGKRITASARDKQTEAYKGRTKTQRANNIDDNFTKQITTTDTNYTKRKVAKNKNKKTPTIKIKKTLSDGSETVITKAYKPSGDFSDKKKKMEEMEKKKRRNYR